jgi:hypothetical protein
MDPENCSQFVSAFKNASQLICKNHALAYIAQVVVENLCSGRTIMPAFRFTDKRYYEKTDFQIANLPPNHYQVFNVPYDVHEVQVWPRVNCQNDGTHCETGGCFGVRQVPENIFKRSLHMYK